MTGWQLISTAPKNGTKIDLWMDGRRYADVHWSFFRDGRTGKALADPIWDGWAWDGSEGMSYTPRYIPDKGERATHWMPISEGPSES